ncbi:MAG: alpha-ketoacid dehydrogenase subunit beta, partial [Actinobacteria bacterium]|nr:alpha-ketoacid dehydrogenase subunit beta [Actinomycetota bacterium]
TIPFGVADIKREGSDVTVVAYSNMLFKALEAAEELEKDGISCEVVDPRTLVPMDFNTIVGSVKKTGRLVVVTEACRRGSVASDIVAKVTEKTFDWLDGPAKIVAGLNTPIPYNSTLEQASIPHKKDIEAAVRELLLQDHIKE